MLTVYFAGPDFFYPDFEARKRYLRGLCLASGIAPLFPENIPGTPKEIFRRNLDCIARADGVIANLDPFRGAEPDSGTVFECGLAWGWGKFIVGIVSDQRSLREKLGAGADGRDAGGASIEDFGLPLNLMLTQAALGLADSVEEAVRMAHRADMEKAFSTFSVNKPVDN